MKAINGLLSGSTHFVNQKVKTMFSPDNTYTQNLCCDFIDVKLKLLYAKFALNLTIIKELRMVGSNGSPLSNLFNLEKDHICLVKFPMSFA